jgi:hypothetical protein
MPRTFKPKLIDQEFDKTRKLPWECFEFRRREALQKVRREPKDPNRIIAPVDFNPHLPKVSLVFQKHHEAMLFSAPHLGKMFP